MTNCCKPWADAHKCATDNACYQRLIYDNEDGTAGIGTGLPPILFCPWCGADKREPTSLEAAAKRVVALCFESRGEWDDLKEAIGSLGDVLDREKK